MYKCPPSFAARWYRTRQRIAVLCFHPGSCRANCGRILRRCNSRGTFGGSLRTVLCTQDSITIKWSNEYPPAVKKRAEVFWLQTQGMGQALARRCAEHTLSLPRCRSWAAPSTADSAQHRRQRPTLWTEPGTTDSAHSLPQDFKPCQKPIQRNAFESRSGGQGSTAQVLLKA